MGHLGGQGWPDEHVIWHPHADLHVKLIKWVTQPRLVLVRTDWWMGYYRDVDTKLEQVLQGCGLRRVATVGLRLTTASDLTPEGHVGGATGQSFYDTQWQRVLVPS